MADVPLAVQTSARQEVDGSSLSNDMDGTKTNRMDAARQKGDQSHGMAVFPASGHLFEEITDLLAEALYQDFQWHRQATVNSPLGINHKKLLTEAMNENM